MFSMDNFGAWLVRQLEERGLTQSDLSRMSGLSRGTLSNIISSTRGRGPNSLMAIARALKIPLETVYRAAGLLPPESGSDEKVSEITHIYHELNTSNRDDLLDYARLRLQKQERDKAGKRARTP